MKINHLDHVAILVEDLERSANWYAETLNLRRIEVKEWGAFPIMMWAHESDSGVAIFPKKENMENPIIQYFAFNVTVENFEAFRQSFEAKNIKYLLKDHTYYHSMYITDPDGYSVELTTLVKTLENL